MTPTFMGESAAFELVGEGEFPDELDRVNIGALWLTGLWALFNGFWLWVLGIGFCLVLIDAAGLAFIQLEQLAPVSFGAYQAAVQIMASFVLWTATCALALSGDRLIWNRERRLSDRPGHIPIPAWRYARSQRRWAIAARLLAVFGYSVSALLVLARPAVISVGGWVDLLLAALVPAGVFVYSGLRATRREANKRIEPTAQAPYHAQDA